MSKSLQMWLEDHKIDSEKGVALSLCTAGLSPSKGPLLGLSLVPMDSTEVTTIYLSGAEQHKVEEAEKFTGVSWAEYSLRARGAGPAAEKIQELLEDTHWLACYNMVGFMQRWFGEDPMGKFLDFPFIDVNNYMRMYEKGGTLADKPYDDVFSLADDMAANYGKGKTELGACSFPALVSRYVPQSTIVEPSKGVVPMEANTLNLKSLMERALLIQ